MGESAAFCPLEFFKTAPFVIAESSPGESKEYRTGEKGRVCHRQFLAGHNYAAIHRCRFPALLILHIQPRTAGAIPDAFQELMLFERNVILILIQMHDGIAHYGNAVRPAVFLKSGVSISEGNGSQSNPFVLG